MTESFKYIDKEFKLNTINNQKTFYYKIKKPVEVWGNYYCEISFFKKNGQLIYHRNDCFAHVLKSDDFLGFVKWSKTGDIAIFYEFKRGSVPGNGIYDYIILLLEEEIAYRLDQLKYEHSYFSQLQDLQFDNMQVMEHLLQLGIDGEECYTDSKNFS